MMTDTELEVIGQGISISIVNALREVLPKGNCPEFALGSVPVAVAAKVYGKDANWVRAGIIAGWLPIGTATRDGEIVNDISQMDAKYGKISYTISPRKLGEDTGFVWKGEI